MDEFLSHDADHAELVVRLPKLQQQLYRAEESLEDLDTKLHFCACGKPAVFKAYNAKGEPGFVCNSKEDRVYEDRLYDDCHAIFGTTHVYDSLCLEWEEFAIQAE